MSSLKTLNKLPSKRTFNAAEKWTEVLELMALFLLKTETYDDS